MPAPAPLRPGALLGLWGTAGAALLGLGIWTALRAKNTPPSIASAPAPGTGASPNAGSSMRPDPGPGAPFVLPSLYPEVAEVKAPMNLLGPATFDASLHRLATTVLGQPYSWGGGSPGASWPAGGPGLGGGRGWDCSGLALATLAALGLWPWDGPDLTSAPMAQQAEAVPVGQQRPGDLAYYPRHVVVVLTRPGPDGHSAVVSASGGGPTTNGDDPKARVQVHETARYRPDFVTFMRLTRPVGREQLDTVMALHQLLAGEAVQALDPARDAARRQRLARHYSALPPVARFLAQQRSLV